MELPAAFIHSLRNTTGFNKEAFEQVHRSGRQLTSIRLNPFKIPLINRPSNRETEIEKQETKNGQQQTGQEKIPWSSNGYYLSERPSFTADPLFHAGAYYVQEASSMFLEEALKQTVNLSMPLKVLDLCAAPGGKSTLLQSLISNDSLLVSNEVIKTRVNILAENINKWGGDNVIVTNNDAKDFQRLPAFFDVIIVDAPCSGSGLFRKDPNAIGEWSEDNVQLCSRRQQRILADCLPSLKPEGILIYSTCSYSEEEDEQIADWLIKTFNVESLGLTVEADWGIVETQSVYHNAYGYRFYPDKVKGEGFFIAVFKKQAGEEIAVKKYTGRSVKLSVSEKEVIRYYLNRPDNFLFMQQNEEIIALSQHLENSLAAIQSCMYIKKAGVKMGTVIRNELIPHHELAVSTIIDAHVPSVQANLETALQYLRKKEIQIDTALKGWALIRYESLPLGWIKILNNRINNYYPKGWRILNS